MDLNKLAQELGGKPVTDLDSLASELGGQVASTPGGYGAGTLGKDVGKLVTSGAVKGIAGAPETIQAAGSATARESLFAPTETLNLIADPRRLANKLIGSVGLPPIFETTKEKPLVPTDVTAKQRAAVDETLAKGKIPQLRQLTEFGNKISEDIENTISPEMRLAMAESQPTGNIIKALETGDFSEVSMGKNPTALGLTGQAVKVFGSSAPALLTALVTKSAGPATAVGFGQAGAEGIDEARNYIKGMSDEQLAKNSEYFRNLVALGYSTNEARQLTEDKAADTASLAQGSVGALGGAFTAKLLQGGFDKTLLGSAKSRLGKIVQGTAIAGTEGALTEMAEGVATDLSIDKTVVREIGVDSFANLVLGAIGEAAPGVIRGAVAPGEKVKGAEAPEVPPAPAPVTPVTPAAAAPTVTPSAVVGEGDFEVEGALPPAPVTGVTPPIKSLLTEDDILNEKRSLYSYLIETAGRPQDVAAKTMTTWQDKANESSQPQNVWESENGAIGVVASNQKAPFKNAKLLGTVYPEGYSGPDAGQAKETPPAGVTPPAPPEEINNRIAQLQAEFQQIDQAYATATPSQFAQLNARQGQIKNEIAALQAGAPVTQAAAAPEIKAPEATLPSNKDIKTKEIVKASKPTETEVKPKSTEEAPKTELQKVMENEEKLESPTISKTSVVPHATVYVAPYKDGFVSSFQYNGGGKSQLNITTPLDLEKIFPTRQRAIDYAALEIRRRAQKDDNKIALNWLESISQTIKEINQKSQAEINRDRQAEKKAASEKAKQPVDTSGVKDLIEGKIKKVLGWTIYKRKVDPDFWYVQSPDNHAENKIGTGDDVSTNLDTARARIEQYIADAEYDARKAAEKPTEKKAKTEKANEVKPKIEDIVSPEVASAMKDIEFQKKLIKANNEKSITEAQFSKVFNLQQSGKTAEADAQLTKILEKKEKKNKEEHIEGNKSEPITSKTIEDAIDKADDKVDAKKIKQSIKNQFDQAIKRADIPTEKEWANSKKYTGATPYVTISIPGDGKFKVKNNKERLEELQKRLIAAIPLKEGKPKREVSAVSVSSAETAFKAMVDDKDMENAIEYAKLQNFDINKAKLNPTQKATVDSYLKNPAEFERQQEEAKSMEEAKTTALRADQEKRARERIEADEQREEEARFKAVIDTTVRSTEAQLKRDIADRKISTKDARRMVEAFPNYPEGVVKPYTIRLIEKRAGVEPSFQKLKKNITETGQRLSHPLVKDLVFSDNYEMLDLRNPRTYIDKAGKPHRTFEKNGVRMSFTFGETLFQPEGEESRAPQTAIGDEKDVHFRALLVDPEIRRQGKATTALKAITYFADRDANQLTLYLEPAELEKNGINKEQLTNLYSKFQFKPTNASGKIMVREPESVEDAMKRVNAEMKAKGIEPEYVRLVRESKELDEALAKLKQKALPDESRTIDVEAVDITPAQVKLLTNQVNKLSDADIATLEEHYGVANYSSDFMKRIREDVVKYVNKGADAVDAAIRSIIAKLQAGLLSVAVVFNPATFQTPDFDIPRFVEETKTITAVVPQRAEMSAIADKAYSITAPAFIKANKAFFIADKPNGKIHLFDTDGKFLKSSDALYGKQAGDVLTAEAREMKIQDMKDIDKITPAGVFNLSVNANPDYTGGYTLLFTDDKGDVGGVAIHAVYTGDVKENREAKLASKDPKDKKISFGCINVDTSFFTGNIIPRIDKMENAGVVVIPDAQEQLDLFIKPTTEKVAAPAKEIKTAERTKIVGRETPYYNDFTSNLDESYFDKQIVKTREEKISEYTQARAATRRLTKKVAKYGSDLPLQKELNALLESEEVLKSYIDSTRPTRNNAEDFVARATKEMADGNISPEVESFIRTVFEKSPGILQGLRLSVRSKKGDSRDAGNFTPYSRLITLWKDGSGVENPKTIRHELTHSLEQMMLPETKQVLIDQWARSFERAMKVHTDEPSRKFFDAVLDFLENPNKENFDKATKIMPSYDYYQYMNPSEYWAVNAEAMLGAKLGGAWSRFTNAVKKLLEGLKSFFGMDNKFAVHKAMDQILSGDMKRISKDTLVDYLLQGEYKIDFLENVEETDALLEKHKRPEAPIRPSHTVKDAFMGGYDKSKNIVKKIQESPLIAASNMVGKADRALTNQRNKNIFYGTGLEEADRAKYGGQVRNAHGQAIASVALINAIHSGHVATQVMTQGKLEFNPKTQMFQAVKDKYSIANVVRAKAELVKKLGDTRAAKVIQAFFEAKRSRSIINEYLDRTAAYENAKAAGIKGDDLAELKKELNNIEIVMQKINMTDEAIDDFIKLDETYPELKEMMENWTAVNQNMIDIMEFSGLISKQRAKTLRDIKDYVPWYRIMDDQIDIHSPPGGTRGVTNVGREKKFKSGEVDRDIDDIVDNMVHNVLTLTRNSMRNYAANRIVMEYGTRNEKGKLKVFATEGADNDGVRFNIVAAGRRIVVQIKDPLVAEAVIGMENIDIPMINALAYLANGLRRSITTFPAFQVVQLFMDAPTAALVTGLKRPDKVWAGVFTSFLKNLRKDDPIVATLRSYGIGGYQSSARTPEKEIQMDIGLIQGSWFAKAMKGLDRFGDASDYAQRRSVYLQTLKETGDELLAVFQANNVIDFQKRGSGQIAQTVTKTVAFMNAYAQSIDVLAKGLAGGGLKGLSRSQAFARMFATGMLLSASTIIYCMLVGDDDEYNKLDDQTKMRNIYIPGLDMRLPMHTGASFFFKAIPELIYNAIMKEGTKDEYDKKRLTRALSKSAADSLLGPNITPSGVKPVVEIVLNKNFFTGGQVTPKGMEDLAAFRQYNQNTSELGKIISALTGTEKTRLLNPMEADHLMRGLLGTAGAAAMWGTNMLIGNRPEPQAKDNPFYGQFIMPDVPRGREDLYYDLKTKTDEAYKTHQDLLKKGRKEEAQQWFKENKELIQVYGYTSSIESSLKELNGEIRRIGDQPENKMTSKQKRDRINELQEIKGRVLKDVIPMRKRAGMDKEY